MFGKIARQPEDSISRRMIFAEAFTPRVAFGPRRRGRPRTSWVKAVHSVALAMVGGCPDHLVGLLQNTRTAAASWAKAMADYFAE